ncbi:MAG: type II secretion system F family protein [Candidatus Dormibacteraeota bacterium]|nr:type II secretion system F family protein [Candidatus Dormibacteraeota bacterium]
MTLLAIGIAVVAALGVLLIMFGLTMSLAPKPGDLLEARLAQFTELGRQPATLTEVELTLPFFERAIRPVLDTVGSFITRRMRAGSLEQLQENLNLAGRPWGLTASGFYLLRILSLLLFIPLGFGASVLLTLDMPMWLVGPVGGGVLGYLVPQMLLESRIKKRKHQILLAMPSALDLLTISVEAGLSFDAALTRVAEKYDNPLTQEITQVLNEVRLGRPRVEALEDMARRCRVEELTNFVQAVVQSEQLGVGIANVLRIQSEEIRRRRRQRAEELGQKAPIKMLFPMVGCIFPTLFIVLLGPAVIQVAHTFGSK